MTVHKKQNNFPFPAKPSEILQHRNILVSCLIVATLFIVIYSYLSIKNTIYFTVNSSTETAADFADVMREKALQTSMDRISTIATAKAYQVGTELEKAVAAASTLAEVLSGMVSAEVVVDVGRDAVNSMLLTILQNHEKFMGVYTVWEPDAFDMLDLAYINTQGHDTTGRFVPYWYRNGDNQISVQPTKGYDNRATDHNGTAIGAYYLTPQQTGKIHIIDPHIREINGNKVWIVSVVVPVMADNKFQGIIGIDIGIDFIRKIADETVKELFRGQSKIMFISQNGILVAASGAPEDSGLPMKTILSKWIEDGNNIDNYIVTYSPLMIERILTPWSVRIIAPKKIVELDADKIYKEMMNDVKSLDHALKKGSIGALWKLSGVGLILAITTFLIMMLLRTVENREESLRTSQEEFRAIAENTTDCIMRYDRAGRHLYGNPMALNATGVTAEEYIGKTHKELGFPEHLCELWATAIQQVIKTGKHQDVSFEVELQNGTVHLELSLDPEFDVDGNVASVLGISRDITYIKQAQEEKSNLEKRLQQAQKMEAIGTLAGGIAHDFNNILGAILGYTEMARDDSQPGSTVAKDLDKVLDASNRAKALIQQILSFSRQADTECISFQPSSIINETMKMLRPSLPATIEITQDIDPATGLIFADPSQINQIVMNLCTNAFHAMEETGGKLDISLKEVTLNSENLPDEPSVEAGTFIQLSICDSGPGIAPDIKEKIFEPYFTTKETGKGTGMGLSIVHGIVKSYGGFISLYSEPGEGTSFHVFLPVIEKELQPEIEDVEQIPVGKDRILFIDDEEILAEMGKSMLERLGYHVTVRNNSIEALETFQNQPDLFDLVITDQTMPGMTGADIARRMIQIRPDIPIILCTGYSTVISEEKAKSMGIKEFAVKPLSKKGIAVLIRKVLGNS